MADTANLSKGTQLAGKRPLFENSDGFSLSLAEFGGSPPKKLTIGLFREEYSASVAANHHPYQRKMVVQESAAVDEVKPHVNGVNGVGHQNGHSSAGDEVDYFVVLYGCSGYGELAYKLNTTLPPASLADATQNHSGSSSSVGIIDNQALWLWDEEAETVLLSWAVVDCKLNKVLAVEQRLVRPGNCDGKDDNELVKESFHLLSGIEAEDIKTSGHDLENVVQQIAEDVRRLAKGKIAVVTAGSELLRQQLLPECARRGVTLPDFFFSYFDVLLDFDFDAIPPVDRNIPKFLDTILDNNHLVPDTRTEYGTQNLVKIVKLLQFMVDNGHGFPLGDISQKYLPGLCKTESAPDDCIVKARGLPWQASDLDVSRFFYGLDIPRGGIALCLSSYGRRNGEAIVLFGNVSQRDMALQRHRHHMQNRYIEVYRAVSEDFQQVAGACSSEVERFLKRDAGVIIRMRGLPYDANAKQIIDFFASGEKVVQVVDGEDGVMFVKKPDGRPTGDAFVLFKDENDGQIATSKHREVIGSRYIELFRSTTAEVQQVLSKSQDTKNDGPALMASPPNLNLNANLSMRNSSILSAATSTNNGVVKRSCVRLRGLPFEASVDDILDFLGEHAKQIVVHGVHMVYNAQGQPSGEAFIQMNNDMAANRAAMSRHNCYMNMSKYNKKNRYIEVYQCSPDDMNGGGISGGLGMQSVRPLLNGFGTLTNYNPNFNLPVSLPLVLPQLAANLRSTLPGMFSTMPYWPYPTPPMSPNSSNSSQNNSYSSPSVMSAMSSPYFPSLNSLSCVHLRNLPYQATPSDIATFLLGFVSQEAVQINRHNDGRPNGEAFVVFNSRDDAERVIQDRNRQTLGNRPVEMSIIV